MLALTPNSRTGLASRFLRENAALAMSYGLAQDKALRSITLDAAAALGVADRVGSIAVGKDADLAVLTGPPLAASTRVARLFIDGQEIVIEPPRIAEAMNRTSSSAAVSPVRARQVFPGQRIRHG